MINRHGLMLAKEFKTVITERMKEKMAKKDLLLLLDVTVHDLKDSRFSLLELNQKGVNLFLSRLLYVVRDIKKFRIDIQIER